MEHRVACSAFAVAVTCFATCASVSAQPTHVLAQRRIGELAGGFAGQLADGDRFSAAVATLGDLDGDGIEDLAVGAPLDDDGGTDRGAVWILFLGTDASVRETRKISDTQGGFAGVLDDEDHFGNSVAPLGDLNGDGVPDLAVGAPNDDDHDPDVDPDDPKIVDDGAVWILFLQSDGTVKSHAKISMAPGGFPNPEPNTFHSETGYALASLRGASGSLRKLAVGAAGDDDGGPFDRGAVWILTLKPDGTIQTVNKISATHGGFPSALLDAFDRFGNGVSWPGDVDGDGVADLAVGAPNDGDGDPARGAVWILFLRSDSSLKSYRKISASEGGLVVDLPPDQSFGWSLAGPGDLDANGVPDLLVGETKAWAVHPASGAVRVLLLEDDGTVGAQRTIARKDSGLDQTLSNDDRFASACAVIGDLDGDGREEIAVGSSEDADGGSPRGAVWILSLGTDATVTRRTKISDTEGAFYGVLDEADRFGRAIAPLGDIDGDGVEDIAVGAPFDDDGGSDRGAVWILLLDPDGSVKSHRKISQTKGGFGGVLNDADWFGYSLAPLGDLDGDGVVDLAVGAVNDRDGGSGNRGAVWVLFLELGGSVHAQRKISVTQGGFAGQLDPADDFGRGLAALGDLDGDGRSELAVGANRDDDGGPDRGAVWILFLNTDGSVRAYQKISDTEGGFAPPLEDFEGFGWAVGGPGDVDGDGIEDLVVGAPYDNDGGVERGALWTLLLRANARVKSQTKISSTDGGLLGPLSDGANFGYAAARLFDVDGDGQVEVCAGAPGQNSSGFEPRGATWLLSLSAGGGVADESVIDDATPGFEGTISRGAHFGSALAVVDDLDGDGEHDVVVGAADHDGVGTAWLLFLGDTTTTTTPPTTTTTLLASECGDPTGNSTITATDALVVLRSAVGTASCRVCICDIDDSGAITSTDALRVLRFAVGSPVELRCPPCA